VKLNMEMEKKNVAIIVLIIALVASGIGNVVLVITSGGIKTAPDINILRYADTEAGAPAVLDPVDSWDSVSNDVIRHVCDNLWYYDLYDPDFALEMRLATSYEYNLAKDEVEVILRQGVLFHDGAKFNATAVKFTFDRILYLVNATKELTNETAHLADPASLFYNMMGDPILNKTVINSEYNVTFYLNAPNAIFIPLLSYDAWCILHPDSTPADQYLVLGEDKLIGTGPFTYDHFIPGEEMKFKRNALYWGPSVFWDAVIWVYYPDDVTAANAMLGGEVDAGGLIIQLIDQFIADPDIIFTNLESSTIYRYFGLNNHKINETLVRKAICYAFNYTYYIDVIRRGYGIRAHQLVPPGFPYYNATFTAPSQDISVARQAMMDARPVQTHGLTAEGVGVNATNDVNWAALNLMTLKILEHEDWSLGQDMNEAFANDLDRIGISLVPDIMDWETYIDVSTNNEDRLEIFHTGWGPDYLDPFNMVAPLLSNLSSANHIQCQDALVQGWLQDYEVETDPDAKAQLLYWIQNRVLNVEYMELAVQYDMVMAVYHKSVGNPCINIQRNLWFRDSYFIPGVPRAGE
jgi:peptide/nickel transport system substrate-binding protein